MKFTPPQMSKCFHHPEYDFMDDNIPKYIDGKDCVSCWCAHKLTMEQFAVYKRFQDGIEERSAKKDIEVQPKYNYKLTETTNVKVTDKCPKHPAYKGMRRRWADPCETCDAILNARRKLGIKETRRGRL